MTYQEKVEAELRRMQGDLIKVLSEFSSMERLTSVDASLLAYLKSLNGQIKLSLDFVHDYNLYMAEQARKTATRSLDEEPPKKP